MILSTTHQLEGHRVSQYCGVVSGQAIFGANVFRDMFAGIRDFFGGRAGSYEKVLRDGRDQAIADMIEEARKLGANAIVGIDLDYSAVGNKGSMLLVTATGTAVKAG
ncbi:MAG: YbjQ family protein [Alphaproteobacteria bacterium]|nr:YbjQ family protein [Alphaproteobacteria bacterium]